MGINKEKPFNINVGEREMHLTARNTLVLLHRHETYQDVDFFQVFHDATEETISVYRNAELCRWMAGIAFRGADAYTPKNKDRKSFRDTYGWSPRVVVREVPDEDEIDAWVELTIDKDVHEDGSFELPEDDE